MNRRLLGFVSIIVLTFILIGATMFTSNASSQPDSTGVIIDTTAIRANANCGDATKITTIPCHEPDEAKTSPPPSTGELICPKGGEPTTIGCFRR